MRGKVLVEFISAVLVKDHPRTCGEKFQFCHSLQIFLGSPPHMRGKVSPAFAQDHPRRITPAHAGKSSVGSLCGMISGDHPRTCGEKSCIRCKSLYFSGSPPHMRGKAPLYTLVQTPFRITPAHAGKSSSSE